MRRVGYGNPWPFLTPASTGCRAQLPKPAACCAGPISIWSYQWEIRKPVIWRHFWRPGDDGAHGCHFTETRGASIRIGNAAGVDPGYKPDPERRVLKGAARIVVCTEKMKTALATTYGIEPGRISSTPLSIADLDAYEAVRGVQSAGFHLVYTGTIYQALQDPLPFLRAASRIEGGALRLSFIGAIPAEIVRAAGACGLNAEFPGWRESQAIIAEQKSATALLIFGHRGSQVMPSKIYEYLAARRPILGICADDSDLLAPIIHKHRRGLTVANREDDIERALRGLIELHTRSQLDAAFDLSLLPQYALTATMRSLMAGILSAAIAPSRAPAAAAAAQDTI